MDGGMLITVTIDTVIMSQACQIQQHNYITPVHTLLKIYFYD